MSGIHCVFSGAPRRSPPRRVLTLALGIGANAAVFSILNAVIFRPLPFPDSDRLVSVQSRDTRGTPHPTLLSYPTFFDFRRSNRVFEHLACYRDEAFTLTDRVPAAHMAGEIVSWDLFAALGVAPVLGRGFVAEEERPGTRVAVLSHDLWMTRFGGDEATVGRTISLDREPYVVVGVAPRGFSFPVGGRPVQVWVTLGRDGGSLESARRTDARFRRAAEAWRLARPGAGGNGRARCGHRCRPSGSESQHRQHVCAIRAGPPRRRYASTVDDSSRGRCAAAAHCLRQHRQLASRSGHGSCARACDARRHRREPGAADPAGADRESCARRRWKRGRNPARGDRRPPRRAVLARGSAAGDRYRGRLERGCLLRMPCPRHCRRDRAADRVSTGACGHQSNRCRTGSWGNTPGSDWVRNGLVVAQVALGLILLCAATLVLEGFRRLVQRDAGFQPDHLLSFAISLPGEAYADGRQEIFIGRLLERLAGVPGVTAVAAGSPLPLSGDQMASRFGIEERRRHRQTGRQRTWRS